MTQVDWVSIDNFPHGFSITFNRVTNGNNVTRKYTRPTCASVRRLNILVSINDQWHTKPWVSPFSEGLVRSSSTVIFPNWKRS